MLDNQWFQVDDVWAGRLGAAGPEAIADHLSAEQQAVRASTCHFIGILVHKLYNGTYVVLLV